MRRLVGLLARMYPAEWRARYGDEFDSLLEDKTPRFRDVLDVGWGAMKMHFISRTFLRIVLLCAIVGALIAVLLSVVRPPMYLSGTPIEVTTNSDGGVCGDQSDLPMKLQGHRPPVCVASFFTGLNSEFLAKTIQKHHLYPGIALEDATDTMRKNVFVRLSGEGKDKFDFVVQFGYPDAHLAQQVNGELIAQVIRTTLADAERLGASRKSSDGPVGSVYVMRSRETFRVLKAPSLPQVPVGLSWEEMGMIGLAGGFLGGVVITAVLQLRKVAAVVESE